MYFRAFVLVFLAMFHRAWGQQKEFHHSDKNRVGLVYKSIFPVNNPHDKIIRHSYNFGLGYSRFLRANQAMGLNVYYSKSKYLRNLVGFEPFYKYGFGPGNRRFTPFVKVSAGFQTTVEERWIIFTYTRISEGGITVSGYSYQVRPKALYVGPEAGVDIKLGKKYVLEPAVGYMAVVRNYGNKYFDAHLQNIRWWGSSEWSTP
ncbi:hypothetical protein FQZ97_1025170 [compost metagenome]